jgi:formate/nitrite transporter FocA (FNT family)
MRGALERSEQQDAQARVAVRAPVVHETIRLQGDEELRRPPTSLAWSALAAGLSMGFSLIAEGVLASYLPAEVWTPLVVKIGYSIGFLLVIIGRQQLFTENTLTVVIPLLARKNTFTLVRVLRLWAVVLAGNLVGAHIIAWAIASLGVFPAQVQAHFLELGREAAAVTFWTAVFKGIFAGWLIALMVWMLAAAEQGKLAIVVIMTYVVALGSFTHVVAGSVDVLYVVWTGNANWWSYLGNYLAPALLGNSLGGVALVSALNHAQVVSGAGAQPR